ncbi:MAG: methyltransferase domain-containing protein [Saprospiraceae bacterium]
MSDHSKFITLISEHLKNDNEISVLDIGCGDAGMLFSLYNELDLDFKRLVGVDSGVDDAKDPFHFENHFDLNRIYKSQVSFEKELKENVFEYIRKDEMQFIKECTSEFDLIIISNLLHFFKWETILQAIDTSIKLFKKEGIIYLLIANENHPYSQHDDKTILDQAKFEHLEKEYNIVSNEKGDGHYLLIIRSN